MPHPTDIAVGKRLRDLRTQTGISQQLLAQKIGISFQQVQKYERGANRISASRLVQISSVLNVRIESFFQNLETEAIPAHSPGSQSIEREAAKVARDWLKISNADIRQSIGEMIRALSKT